MNSTRNSRMSIHSLEFFQELRDSKAKINQSVSQMRDLTVLFLSVGSRHSTKPSSALVLEWLTVHIVNGFSFCYFIQVGEQRSGGRLA